MDHDERMKDMAEKLEITSSYLSAVEKGKRALPSSWIHKICKNYQLSKSQMNELQLIFSLQTLTDKEAAALEEAMAVIYLNDSSDYLNGLWGVIRAILGDHIIDNEGFSLENWWDQMKTFSEEGEV